MCYNKVKFNQPEFKIKIMPVSPVFKGKFLFQELVVFGLVQIIGLWAAMRLMSYEAFAEIKIATSLWEFLISFVIATILLIISLRFIKGGSFFRGIFALIIFLGSQTVFSIFLPTIFSVGLAIIFVVLQFVLPRVWFHNLAVILGVAGIGAAFGLSLPISAILVILFLISIYDYIAVYKTAQMVMMFKELVVRGVIMALIFPMKWRGWAVNLSKVAPGNEFMFLGTGDLILPLILAVSAISYGLESAVFTIAGSLVGLVVLHVLFTTQPQKTPMPALPPLAFFSVLGFLFSIFIK